jgi:hypothetical protein
VKSRGSRREKRAIIRTGAAVEWRGEGVINQKRKKEKKEM